MHLLVVALRLAKIDPNEGFASNPRHITAESAVTRITLCQVSPCIRLELRRVRAKLLLRRSNAIAERLAHQSLSRPVALGPRPNGPRAASLGRRAPFLRKLSKERLRILQVGSFEAFGEPAVDRREQVVGVPPLAPIGPEPGKIAGGAKFEDARRSVTGIRERCVESGLGNLSVTGVESQAGACSQPVQLGRAKVLASRLSAGQTLFDRGLSLVRSAEPQPGLGEQHEEIGVRVDRAHGRAPVEEISHVLGGAAIPLLVDGAPCGQYARVRVVDGEPMLIGEPRGEDGASVELFEFASELQNHRALVLCVCDHLGLPECQRVRDALRVSSQRPLRIAQKKQSGAADAEGALPGIVAAKGERLRSMAANLVEGEPAVHVVTGRLQIAAVQTRRPQRMARLQLVIGVTVRLGFRQERIAHCNR